VIAIHLLGNPTVAFNGAPVASPRGRKVWALLAYLLRSDTPVTREQLASLLFADADDPLRALRWNLTELRRLLDDPDALKGEMLALSLAPGSYVDVRVLKTASWVEASRVPGLGRELLEGIDFPSSPAFEAWLLNERRHVKASTEAVLREASLALLAAGETETAIDLAARLVALDPLDESYQGLLIRAYAMAGDQGAAARQLAACTDLLRRDLGVEPGPLVTSAMQVGPASWTRPAAGGPRAARAQLEAGQAALKAGALDAGLDCLRRAIAEAHSCGDLELKKQSLFALGSTLAHWGRIRHEDGAAALHEVITLIEMTGDALLRAAVYRELAWIELVAARYGRTEMWLDKAAALAGDDPSEKASILSVRGMYLTEVSRYHDALRNLYESVHLAEQVDDVQQVARSLAMLTRAHLLLGELEETRAIGGKAVEVIRREGWFSMIPWPECYMGEAELIDGNLEAATHLLEHAFALGGQFGDPCFEAKAARTLGLVHAERGDIDAAIEWIEDARMRLITHPDSTWLMAHILDAYCRVAVKHRPETAEKWINDLESLAGRTGMRELLARSYLHRYDQGNVKALDAALLLARDIDNPSLHRLLADRMAVAG
jgi:DNA-binding SARP family transcriptional activator